ncbi:MAG: hypothetical protein J6N93_00970 [Clostridia bacterium]|nr:hypothetical protein [Clostridia bacterium]
MKELEEELRQNGINTQFFLVGSGARNMVTQNENGPIDFDYNLNLLSYDDDWDCRAIKMEVIKAFNQVMRRNNLSDVDDSRSSITTKPIYFTDRKDIEFSMDVCIVAKDDNGNWNRLIHEKNGYDFYNHRYFWNIAPNSKDYSDKARKIKEVPGYWEKVREFYIKIKNKYLRENDYNHPSFICYIEAINDVYNLMSARGIYTIKPDYFKEKGKPRKICLR